MATMKSSGDLLSSISTLIPDNNSAAISAMDIRVNMEDTVFSINRIVASGDTDVQFPFYSDVRAKKDGSSGGTFIAESGIIFPNSPVNAASRQVQPFLGVGNLQHDSLGGLTTGDPHTQYVNISGIKAGRVMTGNLAIGNNYISNSGTAARGFYFRPNASGTETVEIYGGGLKFQDGSQVDTFKGSARAYLNFDASGSVAPHNAVIRSYFNIKHVRKEAAGKFVVTFTSGTFADNNYVAIGTSNATTASGSMEDFDINTVACVSRSGDDSASLRSCTFVIRNDNGEYVDAEVNDFVVYGRRPNEASGTVPTVS